MRLLGELLNLVGCAISSRGKTPPPSRIPEWVGLLVFFILGAGVLAHTIWSLYFRSR